MKYIDLTHTFTSKMPVYPGDPFSQLEKQDKDGIVDHIIKTGMHVGTHMDAPAHMLEQGKLLSDFEPENFFGPGVLVEVFNKNQIGRESLIGHKVKAGDVVIFSTGYYKKFRDLEYYTKYPAMTLDLAKELVKVGVKIVAFDTPSPDYEPYEIHKLLFEHNILIIENLTNLEELLDAEKFEIIALPAKFQTEAAPVRVVAKISE
jgi:kynurenine formamidase